MISIKGATRATLYDDSLDAFRYGSVESLSAKQILELKKEIGLFKGRTEKYLRSIKCSFTKN